MKKNITENQNESQTDGGNEKIRARLSVDLGAYPDVARMMNAALLASGESATELTVQALQRQLPIIVREMIAARQAGVKEFLENYPVPKEANSSATGDTHDTTALEKASKLLTENLRKSYRK